MEDEVSPSISEYVVRFYVLQALRETQNKSKE